MRESQNDTIFGAKWAVALCAALVIGFALVAAFAIYDKSRIGMVERVEEPTAVGDKAYFKPPATFDSGAVFVNYGGQPLHPTGTSRLELRDSKAIKAGMDDSKTYWIYKSIERGGPGSDYFFLKVAGGSYIEVSPQKMPE